MWIGLPGLRIFLDLFPYSFGNGLCPHKAGKAFDNRRTEPRVQHWDIFVGPVSVKSRGQAMDSFQAIDQRLGTHDARRQRVGEKFLMAGHRLGNAKKHPAIEKERKLKEGPASAFAAQ